MLADTRPQALKKTGAYSLEHVEEFFGLRTTQMPTNPFPVPEWHDSIRIPKLPLPD
jgi:hypothetical protein